MNARFISRPHRGLRWLVLFGWIVSSFGSNSFPVARAQNAEYSGAASPAVQSDSNGSGACHSGSGWRWASGPMQPEAAQRAKQALTEHGIAGIVTAYGFGEEDECGKFELYSVDYDVSLANDPPAATTAQQELGNTIRSILSRVTKPELGHVRVHYGKNDLAKTIEPAAAPGPTIRPNAALGTVPTLSKKVYLLVYDPILSNGQKLHSYMGWDSPFTLTQQVIASFLTASHNQLAYQVAYTTEVTSEWPLLLDGYRYTENEFITAYQNHAPHQPGDADYGYMLGNPALDICGKLNRGEVDELWVYSNPYGGMYESRLVGPHGYWYNSPALETTYGCNKLLPMMGLNYERGVPEALHSFGHRAESSMVRVYGSWQENRTANNWDRFALVKFQSPAYSYSGCGSIHFPPNGVADYDYSNPQSALTNCADFQNYPNLSNPLSVATPVTCTAWNCSHYDYLIYWYSHLPSNPGCAADAMANNWWPYFADPNQALVPSGSCPPPPCPTITDWKGEYWNNPWLAGPPALCRNDVNVNFDWMGGSPDPIIPSDNFSARWTRTANFNAGVYRFHVFHDDGARLYIDNVLVPGADHWARCCEWDTFDVPLQAGNHNVRLEMFEGGGVAGAQLWWEDYTASAHNTDIYIGGLKFGDHYLLPGGQWSPSYPGMFAGPVHVVSTSGNIMASERQIFGPSFAEAMGIPGNQLSTDYWFSWYDGKYMQTWISIGAPDTNTQAALVDIYIGGTKKNATSYSIPPGGQVSPNFPGAFNGPVHVVSTNGQNIFTSERQIYGSSFAESMGVPGNQLTSEYWLSWYDGQYMQTWISIGAPNTNIGNALVDIYVGGIKKNATSYSIPPGGQVSPSFPGTFAGPVRVVSTNGKNLIVTERQIFGSSFAESTGVPGNQLTTDYWFSWYDGVYMQSWISIGAPNTNATNALVDIYVGTQKMNTTSYSIPPGGQMSPKFPGAFAGPVHVVSTNGQKIFTTERQIYGSSFAEAMGTPGDQLTTDYWFPWYDGVYMQTWISIGKP